MFKSGKGTPLKDQEFGPNLGPIVKMLKQQNDEQTLFQQENKESESLIATIKAQMFTVAKDNHACLDVYEQKNPNIDILGQKLDALRASYRMLSISYTRLFTDFKDAESALQKIEDALNKVKKEKKLTPHELKIYDACLEMLNANRTHLVLIKEVRQLSNEVNGPGLEDKMAEINIAVGETIQSIEKQLSAAQQPAAKKAPLNILGFLAGNNASTASPTKNPRPY